MMSLSLVIPAYRQPGCLDLALRSLTAQSQPPADLEIIVVDDDSGDDIGAVVDKYSAALPVRLVTQSVNRGRAAARNAGARVAGGDRIMFLDADSFADPGLLHAHESFHRSFPGSVLLGARHESAWGSVTGAPAPPDGSAWPHVKDLRYKLGLDPATFHTIDVPWMFGFSHNLSLPAADFRACGGFDEQFSGWGFEDLEFAYRLFTSAGRARGYFRFDPAALCYHLPHFRQASRNFAEAGQMLPYLAAKHRSLEVEFVDETSLSVCELLPVYVSRLQLLHDYFDPPAAPAAQAAQAAGPGEDHDTRRRLAATLQPAQQPGRLTVGIGLAALLPQDELTEHIDHQRPGARTAPGLMGMRLPFAGNQFADLVNLDLWRVLIPDHLSALICEGLRVARTVYLGYSAQVPGAAQAGLVTEPDYVRAMLSEYCDTSIIETADELVLIKAKRR
jgi:glycosyltransferase involved in cell wall biosynthesis